MTAPSLTVSPVSQLSFAGGALLIRVLSPSPAVGLQTRVLKNDQMSSKPHGYLTLNMALPRHHSGFFRTFLFPQVLGNFPFLIESVLLPNWFPHPQVAGDHRGGDVTGAVHTATGPTSPNLRGDSDSEHLTAGLCHCACISYKKGQRGVTRLSETPCRCVCWVCSAPTHNGLLSAQHERDSIKTVSLNFSL